MTTPQLIRWGETRTSKWMDDDLEAAKAQREAQRGTAEYLSTLLTGPGHICNHPERARPTVVPARLGFFRATEDITTFLDTEKVCQDCYNKATPDGFNVWSTSYKKHYQRNMPTSADYYPRMCQAGTEDDDYPEFDKDVRMPPNTLEFWRQIGDKGQPFYLDQLHLTRPWNPKADDQKAEDRRVARENEPAYKYARRGFVGTGVGGDGANSIAEQRILGSRAEEIPANFGFNRDRATHDEEFDSTHDHEAWRNAQGDRVYEVRRNYSDGFVIPSDDVIDEEERLMTGTVTRPTDGEIERRQQYE